MNRQTTIVTNDQAQHNWLLVDATDQVLGRLSAKLAMILMGKTKPTYTPNADTGDFVVVTHVEKLIIKGSKPQKKFFQTYSGYPSGQKRFSYEWMIENKPELLLERSVRRMLPKNKLASAMLKKLKIYRGAEHPHQAQNPQPVSL
jgi:large subunit ribosomal protein L13